MSKIAALRRALAELSIMIQKPESRKAFSAEYIRGYLHMAALVIAWCNRHEEIEPTTVAPKGKLS